MSVISIQIAAGVARGPKSSVGSGQQNSPPIGGWLSEGRAIAGAERRRREMVRKRERRNCMVDCLLACLLAMGVG